MIRSTIALALTLLLASACNTSSTASTDAEKAQILESQFRAVQQKAPIAGFGPVYFQYADMLAHKGQASDAVAVCQEYASRFAPIEKVRLKEHLEGVGKTLDAEGAPAEAEQVRALIRQHGL